MRQEFPSKEVLADDPKTKPKTMAHKNTIQRQLTNNKPCKKSEALEESNDEAFRTYAIPPTSISLSDIAEKLRHRVMHFCKQYDKSEDKSSFLLFNY